MKPLARTLAFALAVALFPAAVGCGSGATKSDKPADTNPPQTGGSPPAQPAAKDQKGKMPVINTGGDK